VVVAKIGAGTGAARGRGAELGAGVGDGDAAGHGRRAIDGAGKGRRAGGAGRRRDAVSQDRIARFITGIGTATEGRGDGMLRLIVRKLRRRVPARAAGDRAVDCR